MATTTYEIIIKDETGKGVGTNVSGDDNTTPQQPDKPQPQPKPLTPDNNDSKEKASDFNAKFLAKLGYDMVNDFVISRVGQYTRDSLTQQKINAVSSVASNSMAFAVNPVLGGISLATSIVSKSIDYAVATQKEAHAQSNDWQRAGWINRSRN